MKHPFCKVTTRLRVIFFLLALISMSGASAQNRKSNARCSDNCGKKTTKNNTSMNNSKIVACRLTSEELQHRKATVIAALKSAMLERTELENGYLYRFKGDDAHLDQLNEFIKTERACCGFFTFKLTVEDESALLELTGPAGAKDFVNSEIGL